MAGIRLIQSTFCILTLIIAIEAQIYRPFDCRRKNSGCITGECNTDGSCRCSDTQYTGYNCGLRVALIKFGACNVACQNGATCYTVSGTDRCFCPAQFSGDTCTTARVRLIDCAENDITVNINPYAQGPFEGIIFVVGLSGTQGCRLNADQDALLSLSDNPSINPCSTQLEPLRNQDGGTDFVYTVIVQYNPDMSVDTDEKHVFVCSHSLQGNTVGFSMTGVSLDRTAAERLTGTRGTGTFTPVGLVVTTVPNRGALSAVTRVGDSLFLETTLTDTITYSNFRVTSCTAYSSLNLPRLSQSLVVNSCPDESARNNAGVEGITRVGNSILVRFKAFKFTPTPSLFLNCDVQLCTQANLNDCNPLNCADRFGGPGSGIGRRKREALSDTSVNVTGPPVYVVTDDSEIAELFNRKKQSREIDEQSCFESITFIVITSVFAIILMVALVLLVLVCVRIRSDHRNRKSKQTKLNYTNAALTADK